MSSVPWFLLLLRLSLFLFATLSLSLLVVEAGSCALPPPWAYNDNTHNIVFDDEVMGLFSMIERQHSNNRYYRFL